MGKQPTGWPSTTWSGWSHLQPGFVPFWFGAYKISDVADRIVESEVKCLTPTF